MLKGERNENVELKEKCKMKPEGARCIKCKKFVSECQEEQIVPISSKFVKAEGISGIKEHLYRGQMQDSMKVQK